MERVFSGKSIRSQYFVQSEFASVLLANNLTGADDFLALKGGAVVRAVPGRTTRRIELKSPGGSRLITYLKCYECAPTVLCRWPGLTRRIINESLNEWRQIQNLRKFGLPTAEAIASGWRQVENGRIDGFIMTAEIRGARSGYDYWAANHSQSRHLIQQIADLARRFHQAGFIHKDFYLDHIFMAEGNGEVDLTLIDLQRVLGPGKFRERWLLKDFGSLLYSLEKAGVKRGGLLRLFKLYKGDHPLGAVERKFLRKALKRAAWLHGRKPKYGEPESK
ncbi:MAG TPA: lipopolysaccharide kinase InaA family protein [Verrucomicrobiae bacterium]